MVVLNMDPSTLVVDVGTHVGHFLSTGKLLMLIVLFATIPLLLGLFVFKQKPVRLRHRASGVTTVARLGWSWTYWYFGSIVPLCRNDIRAGVWYLLYDLSSFGASRCWISFLYNKQHIARLLQDGWTLDDAAEVEAWARNQLGIHEV